MDILYVRVVPVELGGGEKGTLCCHHGWGWTALKSCVFMHICISPLTRVNAEEQDRKDVGSKSKD